MQTTDLITCRTRTGKQSHYAADGSTVTLCGRWMRTSARNMQVAGQATCDKCQQIADANTFLKKPEA
jgi:hypothetical protein